MGDTKVESAQQSFAQVLVTWWNLHGRKDLPWQNTGDPYKIWISEIMLQQSQVKTVIPFFKKFLDRFPSVACLAESDIDDVLAHWAGLGYYARARNLHRAAVMIHLDFKGVFPSKVDDLIRLPGVGRSTAAAIASLGFDANEAILDGNVKRVLSRLHAVPGVPTESKVEKRLWEIATTSMSDCIMGSRGVYTQAMMDLGATICLKSGRPLCKRCPFLSRCQAFQLGSVEHFPMKKQKKLKGERRTREAHFLMVVSNDEVLLHRRPPSGIWGGLLCFPEFDSLKEMTISLNTIVGADPEGVIVNTTETSYALDDVSHQFSHYTLVLKPHLVLRATNTIPLEDTAYYNISDAMELGLPAPIKTLLQRVKNLVHKTNPPSSGSS